IAMMRRHLILLSGVALVAMGVLSGFPAGHVVAATTPTDWFDEVEKTVSRHFSSLTDYQANDLLHREMVKPLLDRLCEQGFLKRTDATRILDKVPTKDEFLVDQLATPNGRAFMRRVSVYPGAYDRLDRLSRMAHGRQTVRDLIRGPDGEKMIEYMTQSPGGRNLGKMLSRDPGAGQFNAPTGRIYTEAMLLAELRSCCVNPQKSPKPR
ncbi:MAG: hypothetical protein ABFC77_08165, partial [Thermoguttaceae bacterium]